MKRTCFFIIVIVASLVWRAHASLAAEPTLDEIIAGLSATEGKINRVHVKNFDATWEERADEKAPWKATPLRNSGSAWYDLGDEDERPKRPADWERGRVIFDKMVMAWELGTAPFVDAPVDLAFNGHEGRSINLAMIPRKRGRAFRDNSATVTADVPMLLGNRETRFASGIGFSTQFFTEPSGGFTSPPRPRRSLSALLREAQRLKRLPMTSTERVNGVDAVRLRWEVTGGHGGNTYWLDAARGFALVRYEMRVNVPNDRNFDRVDVTELKEVAKGIWFPMAGTMEMTEPGPTRKQTRMTYKAESVSVNDAKWDAALFTPKIPVGYMVVDVRNERIVDGKSVGRVDYIVMPNATTQPLKIGQPIPAVKVEDPQRPE